MKNYVVLKRACQLRVDTRYQWEYLIAATVRQAIVDRDFEWIEDVGIYLCEWAGIDPSAFRQAMEIRYGRTM